MEGRVEKNENFAISDPFTRTRAWPCGWRWCPRGSWSRGTWSGKSADKVTTNSRERHQRRKRTDPFLKRRETCFMYCMRPVPVVCRRFAFCPHSSAVIVFPFDSSATVIQKRRGRNNNRTYTTGAWPPGSRTKRTTCAACGTSDDRSDGRACGSWCGGDRTRWYPSSTGACTRAPGGRDKESA